MIGRSFTKEKLRSNERAYPFFWLCCFSLFSRDALNWAILPLVTPEVREKSSKVRGRFTGDPSYELEYKIERRQNPTGDDEGGDAQGRVDVEEIRLKEEERLAAVIAMINEDTLLVPRGAYVRRPTGFIVPCRTWEGLTPAEAILPKNYLHFRKPKKEDDIGRTKSMRRPAPGLDFLDSIESDIPNGCWTCQLHRGSTVVMRSLLWLGYYFYCIPNTRQYGSAYFGYGDKNLDLPFML